MRKPNINDIDIDCGVTLSELFAIDLSGFDDVPLEQISMSVRLYHILKRSNCDTLKELLNRSPQSIHSVRNAGKGTVYEAIKIAADYSNNNLEFKEVDDMAAKQVDEQTSFASLLSNQLGMDIIPSHYNHVLLADLGLSTSLNNILKVCGILSLEALLECRVEDFKKLPRCGAKMFTEIKQIAKLAINTNNDLAVPFSSIDKPGEVWLNEIPKSYYCLKLEPFIKCYSDRNRKNILNDILGRNTAVTDIQSIATIWDDLSTAEKTVLHRFISWIVTYNLGATIIDNYNNILKNTNSLEILRLRANGNTLESIGDSIGMTRERVRQIESKMARNFRAPNYLSMISAYEGGETILSTEVVKKYVPEHKEEIMYLFVCSARKNDLYDSGSALFFLGATHAVTGKEEKKSIKDVKEKRASFIGYLKSFSGSKEEAFSIGIERYGLNETLVNHIIEEWSNEKIFIDGYSVRKNPIEIRKYVGQQYAQKEISISALHEIYKNIMKKAGFEDKKISDLRAFENALVRDENIFAKPKHKIRSAKITPIEFKAMLGEIEFYGLKDVELSTKYFFDRFKDVLLSYDIQDEYELHNLLRKRLDNQEVEIGRMPMVRIGKGDRESQVLDLLIACAPIEQKELAKEYEKAFGVNAGTVLANFFNCISEYKEGDVFRIDYEELTSEEKETLKNLLTKEIHNIDEIRKDFINRLPDSISTKLNSYNFRKLGYIISGKILLREEHRTMDSYLRFLMLANDTLDFTNQEWLFSNGSFYQSVHRLCADMEIIEFDRHKYVLYSKLEQKGVSKTDIKDYCEKACEFTSGKCFSVHSLRIDGFTHQLDALGFGERFYESLLRYHTGCKKVRIDGKYIFRQGQEDISRGLIIEELVARTGSFDIFDLQEYINKYYGLTISRYNLINAAREKGLFYSDTMEKLYIDYDYFFEEV